MGDTIIARAPERPCATEAEAEEAGQIEPARTNTTVIIGLGLALLVLGSVEYSSSTCLTSTMIHVVRAVCSMIECDHINERYVQSNTKYLVHSSRAP